MEYKSIKELVEKIKKNNIFSWLHKESNKIKGMIISPDTDGFISALLLNNFFGWPIVGFYDGKIISLIDKVDFKEEKEDYLFVDIEILRPTIKSVGHHILLYDAADPHKLLNDIKDVCMQPNNWRGKDVKNNFDTKYPFGTFHLLLSTLYYLEPLNKVFKFDPIMAVIPSIYIDGVFKNLFNYPENCLEWLKYMTDDDKNHPFERLLNHPTTPKDLMVLMSKFFDNLNNIWVTKQKRSRGKISLSKDIDAENKKIKNNITQEFEQYLDYLAKQFSYNFDINSWPIITNKLNVIALNKEIKTTNKGQYNEMMKKNPLNFAVTSKARDGLEYTLDSKKLFLK